MSQRGSFVTEYIDCERCLGIAREMLHGGGKFLHGVDIPTWDADRSLLPIIAGKVGGLGKGDELLTFEFEIGPRLSKRLCHPLRVAVLAEGCEGRVFTFLPKGWEG